MRAVGSIMFAVAVTTTFAAVTATFAAAFAACGVCAATDAASCFTCQAPSPLTVSGVGAVMRKGGPHTHASKALFPGNATAFGAEPSRTQVVSFSMALGANAVSPVATCPVAEAASAPACANLLSVSPLDPLPQSLATTGTSSTPASPCCPGAGIKLAAAAPAPLPSTRHCPQQGLVSQPVTASPGDTVCTGFPFVEPQPDSKSVSEDFNATEPFSRSGDQCAGIPPFSPGSRRTQVEHAETPSPRSARLVPHFPRFHPAWGATTMLAASRHSWSCFSRTALDGGVVRGATPVARAGRGFGSGMATTWTPLQPNTALDLVNRGASPAYVRVDATPPSPVAAGGAPRPALVLFFFILLLSTRRVSPLRPALALSAIALLATVSATPTCTHVSASTGEGVTVCAPPWPRTPTDTPTLGTVAIIEFTMESSGSGLSATAATVNGVDVVSSFSEGGGGLYSVTYTTAAGDTVWPWGGLAVNVALDDGSSFRAVVVPGSAWSEESDARGMATLANSLGRGVCMGDVDGDGDVDVFVAMDDGSQNQLWVNDGSGVFVDVAGAWSVAGDVSDSAYGCGFGDADGDGLLDLMVTRWTDDVIELFVNKGSGFMEEGLTRGLIWADDGLGLSWGDVDGDGDVDVLVCSGNSKVNLLYMNDGAGVFTEEGGTRGMGSIARSSTQAVTADIDGDGDLDVLVVNFGGANELFVNVGAGAFQEVGATRGFNASNDGTGISVGDWSGDGVVDVYVSNRNSRDLLYLNDGGGTFAEVGVGSGMGASTGKSDGVSMVDVEGDGDLDVVVVVWDGADLVWVNDGAGGFGAGSGDLLLGSSASSYFVSSGDIDGDGDVDVVIPESGDVFVNYNAQLGVSRVVVVRPLTAGGVASAFGATVRVECVAGCDGGWVGVRVVDGGSGRFSQNGYDAVVGVPDPAAAYNVSVRWAGDVHPPSNWTTHPRLGGVVPSLVSTPESRLFVVRATGFVASVGLVDPWDYPGVSTRLGLGASAPVAGDTVTIPIVLSPSPNAHDVNITSAVVNGQDVGETWTRLGGGEVVLTYVTEAGGENWPWGGLDVDVIVEDSSGLVSSVSARIVAGSTMAAVSDTGLGESNSAACIADVDNDGDVDVFMPNRFATNRLWLNDGTSVFSQVATAWNVSGLGSFDSRGCAFGDVDGDGLLDLFVANHISNVNHLYMNTGGSFSEQGVARGIAGGESTLGVSMGDVDSDGDVDILVCSSSSSSMNQLFINDGSGVFTEAASDRGIDLQRQDNACVLADVDSDAHLDGLVVGNAGLSLYMNDGVGVFVEGSVDRGFTAASSSRYSFAVGDVSGDGSVDVVVTTFTWRTLLFVNDGRGFFEEVGVEWGLWDTEGYDRGLALVDIEHDGDLDVFVETGGCISLVWVSSGATLSNRTVGQGNYGCSAWGAVLGDFDGDGDQDAFVTWRQLSYESFSAHGGVPNWVTVRPLTAAGAQSASGSVVRVESLGWVGVRVIDGDCGHYSQHGYDAVVGVPDPSAAYNISVRWAGDVHPPSNWTTHPRLGGVVPALLPAASARVFVVRPRLEVSVGSVLPWDYPGVSIRLGLGASAPVAGDTVTIPIVLSPSPNAHDVNITSAVVNGQDMSGSLTAVGNGTFEATYVTEAGGENWPWEGLDVAVSLIDSSGLVGEVDATVVPGTTWTEEGDARGMASLATVNGLGVCMGDVDGDGDVDVFVAMLVGSENQLWMNGGDGVFLDEAAAWNVTGALSVNAYGCGFGDADGDGLLDLMVVRYSVDEDELYMNTGSGFVEDGAARGVGDGDNSVGVSWGDVDGDGDVDVVVCSDVGKVNRLYVNDGEGVFTEDGAGRGMGSIARSSRQSAMADIDGDGDLDVLVVNHGVNELYVNHGTGVFVEGAVDRGFGTSADGYGLSVGDWSGDGVVDVYVTNLNARDLLYLNDGSGVFREVGFELGMGGSEGASFGASTFDIENDGDVDVVVGVSGGADFVWLNHGLCGFSDGSTDLRLGASASARGVSAGDIDGDGDVDVIITRSGDVYINHNAQLGVPRVVVVRPLTAAGAQSAFGATVRVECEAGCGEGWIGVRVIDGGSEYRSQNGYDAVVGVPAPSATYNVSVRWAGDFHPPSNWTTHPRLGGVVPSLLSTPKSRLFVVRPTGLGASLGRILPWDYPGVNTRLGLGASAPVVGDTVVVPVELSPGVTSDEAFVLWAHVNGVDVSGSWAWAGNGTYEVGYETPAGGEDWPWAGLDVRVGVVDGGGLTTSLSEVIVPGSTWSEESDTRGMTLFSGSGIGVCMGDVDGDGDVDVFLALLSGKNSQLWLNDGNGDFLEDAEILGVAGNASDNAYGCGFGDADGDGLLDLMVARYTDDVHELYMNTGGGFTEDGVARGVSVGDDSLNLSWGDVDGDGDMDVFVCSSSGQPNQLYVNDGGGSFAEGGADRGVGGALRTSFQSALVDIDGDGDLDMLVVNNGGANELFVNDGNGEFVEVGADQGFSDDGAGYGISVGDWSGDGAVDAYVTNWVTRDLLYLNDGGGTFAEVGVGRGVVAGAGAGSNGVSMFDLEGDGDLDIVVGHGTGADLVWVNVGHGDFVDGSDALMLGSSSSARGVAVADIDGDGDLDAIMSISGDVYINHNAQPGVHRVVVVRPLTAAGAQSAFGATVRVECVDRCEEEWVGVRVTDGGSGRYSQNGYDAVVGVPIPSATYNVSVRWVGDAHPRANWTTHPRLGGVAPSSLPTIASRTFIVRPSPVSVAMAALPWDYPGVRGRLGSGEAAPVDGDVTDIRVVLSPGANTQDVSVTSASVNGQDVSTSWAHQGSGVFLLQYVTEAGGEDWPWGGLLIEVVVEDSGGLRSSATLSTVPGSTWSEEAGDRMSMSSAAHGVCVGDVDIDGDVDVFVASTTAEDQLWVNDGSGAFSNQADEWGVPGVTSVWSIGCAFGDADGDGLLDLIVALYTGSVDSLFINTGSRFVEEGGARGLSGTERTKSACWGDVDGDDDVDVFLLKDGVNQMLINDGSGVFTDEASSRGVQGSSTSVPAQAVLADIDGDGDLDALVVESTSSLTSKLFLNDGTGTFTDASAPNRFAAAVSAGGMSVGDWNGDGAVDVYVSVLDSRDLLFVNDGYGVFTEAGVERGVGDSTGNSYGSSMLDYELDGDVDIGAATRTAPGLAWVNHGSHATDLAADLSFSVEGSCRALVRCDIDGDGDEDVLTSGCRAVYVSHNAQPGVHRGVVVRPLAASGGQSAFGASVRLECVGGCEGGWVGLRVIDGGSGQNSQNGYDAVVGVPVPSGTYNVSVRWAGDFHPRANWSTHWKLGSIVPSSLPTIASRTFIVRPAPPALTAGVPLPWDFPAVVTRAGEEAPPALGDKVTIPVIVSRAAVDLTAFHATVNGQDVRSSFRLESPGVYTLEYTTVAGQEAWPWAGLRVELAVEDSSGLVSEMMETVVPGTTFAAVATLGVVPASSLGVCSGDVDGDGDSDMVVVLANDINQLYLNVGEGVLVEEVGAFPGSDAGNSVGCAVADVDGDGDLDVFFTFADAADQLFVQAAAVVFGNEGGARGVDGDGASRSAVWGDVDGDGDVDLFVCVHGGAHALAVNDGSGSFANGASAAGVATVKLCEQAIMVDVDGDSDLDVVVANHVDDDELFVNSGDGRFDERASVRGFRHAVDSRGLAAGDVDGDGAFDIVVAQAATPALLFMNDGDGFFSEQGAAWGVNGTAGLLSVAFADLEHDGDLDLVMSGAGGGPSAVWVNHNGFADRSADLGVVTASNCITAVDFDSDGDTDLVFSNPIGVLESYAADGGVLNWLKVRPLTRNFARSAFGAVVRLACVEGCDGEWAAVRSIDGGSGLYGQQAYDAHFGLPLAGTAFDVEVVFVGGASHDKGTDAGLGGVAPGSLVEVVDRPYVVGVVGVFGGDGVLGVNDSMVVVVTAGSGRTDLEPGDGCCLVNGVNVRESFVGDGKGRYNLTYVLGEGDVEWGAGELVVVPTLQSVGGNLSMVEVEYVLGGSPAGDPVSPMIELECRPGVASANVFEPICVSCPGESLSCNFSYAVESTSLTSTHTFVPNANYTSPNSASFFVGPFNDSDIATLKVFAVDGAGNTNTTEVLSWRVDTSSPVTTLVTKPDPVTSRDGANFALQCSEVKCSFEYRFNGGPLTLLGGNGTVGEVLVVDTAMVGGPERVSSVTASNVSFSMNVSDPAMWVNASVGVEVAGLSWELPVVDNVTEVLQLPDLRDGEYVLVAAGKGGDGTSDVTPIKYVFTVDTTPPSVSILLAPMDGERGHPTVVVGADEGDCVFEWRAGPSPLNSSWAVTSSAVIVPEVASSVPHTFEVRAVDPAGNVGDTESMSWTPAVCPDTIPDVVVTSDLEVSVGQRFLTFEVVGGMEWSGFEYMLDDGVWVPLSTPYLVLNDVGLGGDHELHVRAAAPAVCNNVLAGSRPPPQTVEWTEPAPLPLQVTMLTKPDPSTPDVFAEFDLMGSRRLAWFEYSLDGERWTPTEALLRVGPLQAGSHTMRVRAVDSDGVSRGDVQSHSWAITAASDSSVVLTNLPDGEHSLLVIATDEAGSFEVAPKTYVWRVDTTPPTTTANRTSPRFSSSPTAVIAVSCEGEIDDCKFCWTSDTVIGNCSSTSPLFVTAPEDGYHVVDLRAVDSVGLESTEGVDIEWTVDSTPPVVTVLDIDNVLVSPRYDTANVDAVLRNTSLRLNLTANEDVLGFDVVLNGGGVGGGRLVDPILELTALPTIINNLVVSGTDLAGNVAAAVTMRVLVDVTPPDTLPFTNPPPSLTKAFSVTVGVAGEDEASGVAVVEVALVGEGDVMVDVAVVDDASGTVVFGNLTTGVYNVTAVSTDVAGNVDESAVVATMVVDHGTPVSELARAVPELVASSNLTVWMIASEAGQLFARVAPSTDWLPANASGAVTFTGLPDGSHTVELRSVDTAGNEELQPYVSTVLEVDTAPPITSSTVFGEGLVGAVGVPGADVAIPAASISVNVSANEAVAGYWVSVNGTRWRELATGPTIDVAELAEGQSIVSVTSVDLAGNVDPTPSQHAILVDLTPPDSSRIVSVPPSPTLLPNMSVEVAAEDVDGGAGVSHVVVSVIRVGDGVGWEDMVVKGGSGRVWVSGLTTGVYNVSVVGVDSVGNVDSSPGWELVVVDQVPPLSEFKVVLQPFTRSSAVVVWAGANEPAVTSARVVDVVHWLPVNASGAVVFTGLPDGSHTVELRSVDVAGNEEVESFVSAAVVVDTMPPVLFWTAGVEPFTSSSTVSGCFTANDSNHVSYSASPGDVMLHDSCFEMDVVEDGAVVVNVTGTDAAGNVGEVLITSWVLDRVPPSSVVTSSIQDSSPTCVHGTVTVCAAPTAAALTVACDDGSPIVTVSPCWPQYAITLLEATVAAGCAAPTSTRRRLSTNGFFDVPTASFTLDTVDGDGLYAVAVRSVDGAGNVEVGNTTLTWYVDTVAPVSAPTLVQTPDRLVSSTTALFVIQLSDDNSPGQTAFLYKLDDGPETPVSNLPSPNSASVQLELTGLTDGDHKVEVWARDQAGNDSPFVLYDWAIATEAPDVNILSTPAAISADVTPSFVFQAVWPNGTASGSGPEPLAGIEVSLSGDATFTTVCEDTVSTAGVCVWNASLADRGEGTYTVNVRALLGGNTGDPTPHTWTYTLCDDDQYAVVDDDGGIECFPCPPGGDCSGRRTSQTDIAAVQGFWAPPGSTGLRFYECPVEEACLPGGEVIVGNSTLHIVGQCNEGYTGTLCAVCEDGFFEQFGLCVSCGTSEGTAWAITAGILVAVVIGAVLFFKFREVLPKDQLKVMLSFTQIIASANTAYAIPWPPLFADFLNTMRVFLVEAVSLTRASCAQPMTFYASLAVTLVGFKLILVVVVLGPVLLHKAQEWRRRQRRAETATPASAAPTAAPTVQRTASRRSSITQAMTHAVHAARDIDWAKVFKIIFLFLFVAYPGVSLKIMKTFKCVAVEGDFWLVADMRLKCYEGEWYGYALYAFIMGCLYTAGLPLAIVVILFKHRRTLTTKETHAKWGFLYETYGSHAYMWEACELLRKLWLGALVVLMEDGNPLQVTVAVLISGWAHVAHALYKPWKGGSLPGGSQVYMLQHGSLLLTFFVFLMGLLFKVESVDEDGTTYTALSWGMMLACAAFVVAGAALLVHIIVGNFRAQRARGMLKTAPSMKRRGTAAAAQAWAGSGSGHRQPSMPRHVRTSMLGVGRQGSWMSNPLRKGTLGEGKDGGGE